MEPDCFKIETEFGQTVAVQINDEEASFGIIGRDGSRIAYMPKDDAVVLANAILEMVKRN